MKAILVRQYGTPDVLEIEEMSEPKPMPDEILVKTEAIGLNYSDTSIRRGIYPAPGPFPFVLRGEIEGTIQRVGEQVKHLRAGQRVSGIADNGYATYVTLKADQVFVMPSGLSVGKGMLIQGLTAQHLLHLSENFNSVVITAAAGGVGSFLVQLSGLKQVKTIVAMVGSKEKTEFTKSMGATHVISYFDEDWQEQLKKATDQKGADLILDATGGDIGTALTGHLALQGTMVVYGSSSGQPTRIDGQSLINKSNKIMGSTLYHASREDLQKWFDQLAEWILQGKITFKLTSYPFAQVAQAHRDLENRLTQGKVILTL